MNESSPPRRAAGAIDTDIFDWAGTIVDFGSFAPTQVLVDVFAEAGVAIVLDEARGPMGLAKRDLQGWRRVIEKNAFANWAASRLLSTR